ARSVSLGFWDVDCRSFARAACENYRIPESFRWRSDLQPRTAAERAAIERAIERVVERVRPKRIYLPLGAGNHADHTFLAELARAMLPRFEAAGAAPCFYEDQPYSTYAKVDTAAIARAVELPGGRRLEPERVDITTAFERKMQAIAAHRSQFRRDENEARL